MQFRLFQMMGKEIKDMMQASVDAVSANWVAQLIHFSSICITIYIIFYGYLILAGKIQEPVKELVWNLARFALVIGILQSYSTYLELITGAVDELRLFVTNTEKGVTIYASMDDKFIKLGDVYATILKKIGWDPRTWVTGIVQMIFSAVLVVGTVIYCVSVLASELTITALLAIFPLFLFCYMWGWFKEMFAMWIQAVISVILFCLFISLFIEIGYKIATKSLEMDQSVGVYGCFGMLVAGVIVLGGSRISISLADSLSKVSINHTTGTGERVGQAGKLAFNAWRAKKKGPDDGV
ncbi:type IV secretion system protein [Orbus sturtevantii]|uniref:type IV secretion system protein n=1 Tax=Orbus sturtevantii TaxID=3074109 RepID=UPI00370D821A